MNDTLQEAVAAMDAAHFRLALSHDEGDAQIAGELLQARLTVADTAERLGDMIPLRESRDAVGFAAYMFGAVGLVSGLVIGGGGLTALAGLLS